MSKQLRFKSVLGALAIMLALGMSWGSVSAQNLSSEKELMTFALDGVSGVPGTMDRTFEVTVPSGTNVTAMTATFTMSEFANAFIGVNPTVGTPVTGTTTWDYSSPVVWTIEAENHSYDNYTITVKFADPLEGNDIVLMDAAYNKDVPGTCAAIDPILMDTDVVGVDIDGTDITVMVEYGADLSDVTLYATLSAGATVVPAIATTGTAFDFTGVTGIDFTVTSQKGVDKVYTVAIEVGDASVQDHLLTFVVADANSVVPNATNQTIAVELPASVDVTTLKPTWTISEYAVMMDDDPTAIGVSEICSGVDAVGGMQSYNATTMVAHYWIMAEDNSEVSEWVVTFTNAAPSDENDLIALEVEYTKTWGATVCVPISTETVTVMAVIDGTDVTINLPFGVTNVTIQDATGDATEYSALASMVASATPLIDGETITVTSEKGTDKVYDVKFVNAAASNAKMITAYKFKELVNEASPVVNVAWDQDFVGVIDQNAKTIKVEVQWDTDLHDLIAYFMGSPYSTVYVAESFSVAGDVTTYTPQCSDMTINDHSNSLTYVVVAEDGTEERYDVSVTKKAALTGNELIGFMLTDLEMCIGDAMNVDGVYDGMNITATVKNGTDVSALAYAFTVSEGAIADFATSGTDDFTDAVEVTVTAQNGDKAVYTIAVVVRDTDMNSVAKVNKYWFNSLNAEGEINESAKTINVWVPWGTDVKSLVASFELENEPYTRMTRSEDLTDATENAVCVSGVSPVTNFTTPVAYTVFAEDCSTVEYFVTVFITPNVDTGISAFTFDMFGCICHDLDGNSLLVSKIDPFANRIYITLPYDMTDDLDALAPSITITSGASISPKAGVAQDWTNGPVTYTVTAPDGVSKATWEVLVEAPACQETDIYSFSLPEIQVDAADLNGDYKDEVVTIDYTKHTINVLIKKNANLSKVYYEREIGCATICCVSGNCVDNQYLDFSESLCHTCVVTAQDESITQEWTICLTEIDTDCPTVMTESVLAMNCEDTVYVTPSELGEVFIIHEDAIACVNGTPCNCDPSNPLGDTDLIADLIAEKMLSKVSVDTLISTAIPTQGLYSGVYYAYAIDTWGNVSCQSKQKLYIDICEKEVANLTDLRAADPAFMYTVTGEVLVSYEETITGGNLKYVQDAGAGIEIRDMNAGCSTTYGVGAGITGLKGMIMDVRHLSGNDPCNKETACSKVFVPICCYSPTVSSTGNVLAPIEMTFVEFAASPRAYDAMFVRINTPMMLFNDYTGAPQTFVHEADRVDADILAYTATGDGDYFISSVLNTNYIGESYPDEPKIFQGINTYFTWGGTCYGTVTPRWVAQKTGDDSDILDVADCLLMANPTPVKIDGVIPGTCSSLADVDIINEGANKVTITALYLDDMSGQDEFELIFPTPVPFGLDNWGSGNTYTETVQVKFCPKDPGAEEATLVVEYCDGTILEVPIMGTTVSIFDAPYFTNFNFDTEGSVEGWSWDSNQIFHDRWGNNFENGAGQSLKFRWADATPRTGYQDAYITSPGLNLSGMEAPELTYYFGTYFSATFDIQVSNDMQATWTVVKNYGSTTNGNGVGVFKSVDLSAYAGQTIFIRFHSNPGSYWSIDDVRISSKITKPVYAGSSDVVDLGGVQLGDTATATYTVTNVGVSVLEVTKVELTGDASFTLTDNNVYPFEIHDGTYAYTVDPSGDALSVDVSFIPEAVGAQNAMLKVTYGMYEDHVVMVPVTGEGLSCYTAAEAVLGANLAPGQNSWFTYTAEVFQMAYITSCDAGNTTDPYEYSYDTYLQIYSDCEGTLIAENDDLEDACSYNRASSGLLLPLNAGETIKIFWPWMFTSVGDADPFYFHIDATYPIDGDVCETAIPLTLPVVNHFGSTVKFNDDYDLSPCSPYSNYMDGNDKVYSINLEYDGYLTGNILGAYGAIHVLDKCPKEELEKTNCKAFKGGPNGGEFTKRIAAGEYYVIISTWSPPQTVDYLLNMSFEEGSGIDDSSLANSLSVYPNPTNGQFTVSISNVEATDLTVELVNISGQVVYRNEVKAVYTYNEDIDASTFAKGVYYLKVNDGTEVKVEKVVIQ